jgi:hypothetical protein
MIVEIKNKISKYGWLVSLIIGLILITIGIIMKESPFPFLVLGAYMLISFGIFFSIFGLIEKIIK